MTSEGRPAAPGRFGTFQGVFTPSILTILGVIMFLRAGYVTGQAGIGGALLILFIAEVIVVLTALSIAAIATNTPVGGGGAYFMISRTLGPQLGGAIGLTLYLAQAVSVPLYLVGFSQALIQTFPALAPWLAPVALSITTAVFVLNYVGAGWALRAQYAVMAVLGLAIVSLLGGSAIRFDQARFAANWGPGYAAQNLNLWTMFAVFFPAVTGILAGVNMSGDLKDPAKALVRGTLSAIAVGFVVYGLEIILCGGAQNRDDLIYRPYHTLLDHALWGTAFLVVGGVLAATLSSGIGSMLGAPRILQALGSDSVIPGLGFFGRGHGINNEPRRALWLTVFIAVTVAVFATRGESLDAFDTLASITTMFFLATYGMINLAAFVEAFGGNPSFRPRFRVLHWSAPLAGAMACVWVMFMIDAVTAAVATGCIAALHAVISQHSMAATFGDARRGFLYGLTSRNLRQLARLGVDRRNWRPALLVLSGNPQSRLSLAQYAAWLEAGRGMITLAHVMEGSLQACADGRSHQIRELTLEVRSRHPNVFPEVIVAQHPDTSLLTVMQAHSIGPLKPNTLLLGWPPRGTRAPLVGELLRAAGTLGMSALCLVDRGLPSSQKASSRIDVWWRGQKNGSLMVILAYLLTRNPAWRNARIRVLRLVEEADGAPQAQEELHALVRGGRIDADLQVAKADGPVEAALRRYSADADVVFLGFGIPRQGADSAFYDRFNRMLDGLPTTILTCSNGDADLLA
ncbi:amino acid permease [Candidatus Fermentibacteria bacterium]|nr:amino acid permease [Candidatus Fermentibacteria bacterium]